MLLTTLLPLIPSMASVIIQLLEQFKVLHASDDLAGAADVFGAIVAQVGVLKAVQALIAKLRAEGDRAATAEEWAPFAEHFAAHRAALDAAIVAATDKTGA